MMKRTINIASNINVLCVDDATYRLEWFVKNIPQCKIASTVDEALELLKNNEFDLVFLDHDAGISIVLDHTDPKFLDKTFWPVCQHLVETNWNGMAIVHSGNPIGAARMADALKANATVFVLPFGSFDIKNTA